MLFHKVVSIAPVNITAHHAKLDSFSMVISVMNVHAIKKVVINAIQNLAFTANQIEDCII